METELNMIMRQLDSLMERFNFQEARRRETAITRLYLPLPEREAKKALQ